MTTFPVLALALLTSLQQDAPQGAAEQQEVFALLDVFDPLDTSKLPFVRVATGEASRSPGEPWQNMYRFGFLLEANGKQFRVRYFDLDRQLLSCTPAGTPEYRRCGFEPADLREFARSMAAGRAAAPDIQGMGHYRSPETPMSERTESLLIARACARRGYQAEVDALWSIEATRPSGRIRDSLQWDLRTRLVLDFGDASLSWADLLARHERWLAEFPETDKYKTVTDQCDRLRTMVGAAAPEAQDPRAKSTEQLVHDLRHEFRRYFSGGFDASPVPSPEPAPAHANAFDELVRRGFDAVPALFHAWGDKTLTRSVLYCSRHGGSFSVCSVGDLAEDALEEIAGSSQDWHAWRERVVHMGFDQCLLDAVRAGDWNAAGPTRSFLRYYPDRLGQLLDTIRAVKAGKRLPALEALIGDEAVAKRADVIDLLREEARTEDPWKRLQASRVLFALGDVGAVTALVEAWRKGAVLDGDTLEFLVESGEVSVWRTLQGALQSHYYRNLFAGSIAVLCKSQVFRDKTADRLELEQLVRSCLLQLLADDAHFADGVSLAGTRAPVRLHRATFADVGASQLAAWWPEEYRFDPAHSGRVRARQIAALRVADARTSKSTAMVSRVATDDAPELAPLIAAVCQGDATPDQIARLRASGLRALPAVEEALRRLASDHPARPTLAELAATLANRVTEITFARSASALTDDEKARVRAMQGTSPDERTLLAMLVEVAAMPACKGKHAVMRFERTGEGNGVAIEWELVESRPREDEFEISITSAGVSFCQGALDMFEHLGRHDDYLLSLRGGLAATSDNSLEITLSLDAKQGEAR
jgi:hypothetical protein